jgi:hypothetical protein
VDDSTVYSDDKGKTWKTGLQTRLGSPWEDVSCRCTALSYWYELVGEVDSVIAKEEGVETLQSKPSRTTYKYVTKKILQSKVSEIEKQMKAIDEKISLDCLARGCKAI